MSEDQPLSAEANNLTEYRIRVDPAPDKRMLRQFQIARGLVDKPLTVEIDGYQIRASIGRAAYSTTSDDVESAWGGLITVETTAANALKGGVSNALLTAANRISDAIRAAYPNAGLVGQPPLPVSYETRIAGGAWKAWPFSINTPDQALILREPVTAERVEVALQHDVSLTEKLLGQATYWAMHADTLDPESAVLFAAIAAETHAKRTFTDSLAKADYSKIADMLFGVRPRAIDLYDVVARSIVGKSYRTEQPKAFTALRRLFELRNDVAHGGLITRSSSREHAIDEARRGTIAATWATSWLSRIATDSSNTHA